MVGKFVAISTSLIVAAIVLVLDLNSNLAISMFVEKKNTTFAETSFAEARARFEKFDDTTIYGSTVLNAIDTFKEDNLGIIIALRNVDEFTNKIRLKYGEPIEISNEDDIEAPYKDYINPVDNYVETKRLGGIKSIYSDRQFISKLIKNESGETVGLYFKEIS